VIQALMCQFTVDFGAIESAHDISFDDYFGPELQALEALATDGLVEIAPERISVTSRGRLLVRTVAMIFDRYLRAQQVPARYSRVI
jgi:oxygen-independent coproporphyrinogen-3 oxidase